MQAARHTHTHTHMVFLYPSECSKQNSKAIWTRFRKWGILYKEGCLWKKKTRHGRMWCTHLQHKMSNKSWKDMHWDLGPVLGAIMSWVAQSQVHAEFLRTKLMEFLLFCFFFSFGEVGAQGETRRRHVNPLWLGNKAADKGRWGWQPLEETIIL